MVDWSRCVGDLILPAIDNVTSAIAGAPARRSWGSQCREEDRRLSS